MAEARTHLAFELVRFPLEACERRGAVNKHGHTGFHRQRQAGQFYAGVVLAAGRMNVEQMRGLAEIAERHGSGTIRLTVWQNLLISDIPEAHIPAVKAELEVLGLQWNPGSVRGALIACTGNAGCKFAATDTKRHALDIAAYLEPRIALDEPLNLHLTGCGHSCAQHYIGDIGYLGTKIEVGDDMVEGYHVFAGGGYGEHQEIGREIYRNVPAAEVPAVTHKMLAAYLAHRTGTEESFVEFTKRFSTGELKELFGGQLVS
jgi:ferredoxin-nitrite reductase